MTTGPLWGRIPILPDETIAMRLIALPPARVWAMRSTSAPKSRVPGAAR